MNGSRDDVIVQFAVALILAALLVLSLYAPSGSQEVVPPINPEGRYGVGHPQYHQLYQKMHNQTGTDCCNGGDCAPTTARLDPETGLWEAKVEGKWTTVPPDKHVKDAYGLNEFGSVCLIKPTPANPRWLIRCFVPPNSGF